MLFTVSKGVQLYREMKIGAGDGWEVSRGDDGTKKLKREKGGFVAVRNCVSTVAKGVS
jgi:hypothetical protein